MNQTATLASLPSTRREILTILKERGGVRAEELATALGITVSAVRQHLSALDAAGLVGHRELRGGPGRPKFVFQLAPAAEVLFPQAYGALANELLDILEEEDPGVAKRVFERLCENNVTMTHQRMDEKSFHERVETAVAMFESRGFLPRLENLPSGGFRLSLANCPVLEVARKHNRVCECGAAVLTPAFPDAEIAHTEVVLDGAHACVYECVPKKAK